MRESVCRAGLASRSDAGGMREDLVERRLSQTFDAHELARCTVVFFSPAFAGDRGLLRKLIFLLAFSLDRAFKRLKDTCVCVRLTDQLLFSLRSIRHGSAPAKRGSGKK